MIKCFPALSSHQHIETDSFPETLKDKASSSQVIEHESPKSRLFLP